MESGVVSAMCTVRRGLFGRSIQTVSRTRSAAIMQHIGMSGVKMWRMQFSMR